MSRAPGAEVGPHGERLPGTMAIQEKSRVAISQGHARGRAPWRAAPRNHAPSQKGIKRWRAKFKHRVRPQGGRGREFRNLLCGAWSEFEPEFPPESAPPVQPYTTPYFKLRPPRAQARKKNLSLVTGPPTPESALQTRAFRSLHSGFQVTNGVAVAPFRPSRRGEYC